MGNEGRKTGLDEWNDRLDNNLEPESHGDLSADRNAENFSDEVGSGDQSDDPEREINLSDEAENEDNMNQNQPHQTDPRIPLSREE